MIKDDVDLSVAIDILDRKIANLNMAIVREPDNLKFKEDLKVFLEMKKEVSKGNMQLIRKIINNAKK